MTTLPAKLVEPLRQQLAKARGLHRADCDKEADPTNPRLSFEVKCDARRRTGYNVHHLIECAISMYPGTRATPGT